MPRHCCRHRAVPRARLRRVQPLPAPSPVPTRTHFTSETAFPAAMPVAARESPSTRASKARRACPAAELRHMAPSSTPASATAPLCRDRVVQHGGVFERVHGLHVEVVEPRVLQRLLRLHTGPPRKATHAPHVQGQNAANCSAVCNTACRTLSLPALDREAAQQRTEMRASGS